MSLHVRDAALVAAEAWNATKTAEDPEWDGCVMEHKSKLLAAVTSLEKGQPSGIAGLDAFEVKVQRLLADYAAVDDAEVLLLASGDEGAVDADDLPDDFPGLAALEAAGITTYSELEAVEDFTTIPGIGAATAAKITEALEEK